jgi:ABC-type multidrug transport system ATPase subunit
MKALKFEHITFGYRKDKTLFKDLSFEITQPVGKGFVIGLMGVSGSGKSTILKLILGIEKNYQGEISITPSNPIISYVPQEPVLFEHLTPIENAEYFNRIRNYKSKFNRELFNEVAKTLNIEDILKSATSVNEISGGQRQRISLLRAMSIQPDILLLDEPLTGLDEEVKDQFLQTLATLIQRFSLMVIYVTHHRKEAEFISDMILYLEKEKGVVAVTEAKQTNAKLFFNNPPTVSALNATKEIRVNTLQFKQNGDEIIEPVEATLLSTDSNIRLISFQEDAIQFSNDSGFEFEVAAETGTYTLLKLKGTQIVLTIDKELFKAKNNSHIKFILLSGNINLYDNKGQFLQATKIQNNQIAR